MKYKLKFNSIIIEKQKFTVNVSGEFIDPSKTEMQVVIREALEKLRKEAM